MKVVRKDRRTVPFCDLELGDQFEWGGDLYVKTSLMFEAHNAIRISDSCRVMRFAFADDVHPVTIELHVFDKE